jgi:hypothetical protein
MAPSIGIVHWAFPPVTGGAEMYLLTVCPEMVRQGANGHARAEKRFDKARMAADLIDFPQALLREARG